MSALVPVLEIKLALLLAIGVVRRGALASVRGIAQPTNRSEYSMDELEIEQRGRREKSKHESIMREVRIVWNFRRQSSLAIMRPILPLLGVVRRLDSVHGLKIVRGLVLKLN